MFRSPCSKWLFAATLVVAFSAGFARAEDKKGNVIPVFKLSGAISEAGYGSGREPLLYFDGSYRYFQVD